MEPEQRRGHSLKCWWILASAAGFWVGTGIVMVAVFLTEVEGAVSWVEGDSLFFWYAVLSGGAGLLVGMVLGFGQWLVLRREIRKVGGWTLATMLGFGLGNAVGSAVLWHVWRLSPPTRLPIGDFTMGLWCWVSGGATCGLILGSAQWLVLRQVARTPGWWIPINVVSWVIGAVSGRYVGGMILRLLYYGHSAGWTILKAPWYRAPLLSSANVVLAMNWSGHLVMGILVGAMTSLALAWMLKRPIRDPR